MEGLDDLLKDNDHVTLDKSNVQHNIKPVGPDYSNSAIVDFQLSLRGRKSMTKN